jgi:hypothetical protein
MEELMERVYVKTFHSVVLALAIGAASITSAEAHDSFNLGINIGGYGFAPPPVVYYPHPAYYRPAPTVYYSQPFVSYHYLNQPRFNGWHDDNRRWNRGWDRGGRGHWDRGGRNRGGRGHRDHD